MDDVREQPNSAHDFFSIDEARDRLMDRLHTLEPDCFATLCSPKGLALAKTVQDNLVHSVTSGQAIPHAWEADQAKQEYISQRHWHLIAVPERLSKGDLSVPDWRRMSQRERARWKGSSSEYSWITDIADATLRYYVVNQRYGEPVPTSFVALARHDKPSLETRHTFNGQADTVDAKALSLERYLVTDQEWPLLTWNRRIEPRHEARERCMMLLDYALDRIEHEKPASELPDGRFG